MRFPHQFLVVCTTPCTPCIPLVWQESLYCGPLDVRRSKLSVQTDIGINPGFINEAFCSPTRASQNIDSIAPFLWGGFCSRRKTANCSVNQNPTGEQSTLERCPPGVLLDSRVKGHVAEWGGPRDIHHIMAEFTDVPNEGKGPAAAAGGGGGKAEDSYPLTVVYCGGGFGLTSDGAFVCMSTTAAVNTYEYSLRAVCGSTGQRFGE